MRRFVQSFASADGFPADLPPAPADSLVEADDRYNIGIRRSASVILCSDEGIQVEQMQWGLVPRWSKTPETPYTTVTARLDRAARSRLFKDAWEHRRCVVPLNGYYKWDRSAKPAVPYFIQASDGGVLLVAGLWERWDKTEPGLSSFSVLTHANPAIPAPLVPDGPVFLAADRWRKWLDTDAWFPRRFLLNMPQPRLEAYPVSRAIRDPERDEYTLLERVEVTPAMDEPWADDEGEDEDE